ncbi:MAG TPA: VWA domain-containing protein, partial [Phototrophicaceae bacterium]|nr:VWA domain-containing protein [Phototrophicaceae bacterium]
MFENPVILLLLILLPVIGALFVWRTHVRQAALLRVGEDVTRLVEPISQNKRRWKSALWLASVGLVIVALARPVWGLDADIVETRGVAVVVVLDVSASMDAQDVLPSRLEKAKLAIRELLRGAEGNLFGLVLFAGDAFVQFPLTTDVDSALTFVHAASSKSISRQGTAIEDALRLALGTLDERISSSSIIVLMTDGENQDGNPVSAAQEAADRGVTIHVIGYGTPDGDVIPVYDENGKVIKFKTDRASNL